jgi:hypothetical protein
LASNGPASTATLSLEHIFEFHEAFSFFDKDGDCCITLEPRERSTCQLLIKAEVLVLRDRLGRHLVGLNVRRDTSLRVLGLTCLTRGFVQ